MLGVPLALLVAVHPMAPLAGALLLLALPVIWWLAHRPLWLLGMYLILPAVLPPVSLGPIEVTILDALLVPSAIFLLLRGWQGLPFKADRLVCLFLLFIGLAAISTLNFISHAWSFELGIFMRLIRLVEMILPLLVISQLDSALLNRPLFLKVLFGTAIATSLTGIFTFVTGFSVKGAAQTFIVNGVSSLRANGFHGDSGSFGNFIGFSFVVALFTLIYRRELGLSDDRLIGWLASGALGFCCLGLLLSLSRGGMVFAATGVLLALGVMAQRPLHLLKMSVLLAACVGGIQLFLAQFSELQAITNLIPALLDKILGFTEFFTDFDAVSSNRTYYWAQAWEMISASSFLLGHGYKALIAFYGLPPDNNFLGTFVEMGLLGLLTLLALLQHVVREALSMIRAGSYAVGMTLLAVWLGETTNMISADVLTYWHNVPSLLIITYVLIHAKPVNGVQIRSLQ